MQKLILYLSPLNFILCFKSKRHLIINNIHEILIFFFFSSKWKLVKCTNHLKNNKINDNI